LINAAKTLGNDDEAAMAERELRELAAADPQRSHSIGVRPP
jgi:hypothetical protein